MCITTTSKKEEKEKGKIKFPETRGGKVGHNF